MATTNGSCVLSSYDSITDANRLKARLAESRATESMMNVMPKTNLNTKPTLAEVFLEKLKGESQTF